MLSLDRVSVTLSKNLFIRNFDDFSLCFFSGEEDHCQGPSRRYVSCNTQVTISHVS